VWYPHSRCRGGRVRAASADSWAGQGRTGTGNAAGSISWLSLPLSSCSSAESLPVVHVCGGRGKWRIASRASSAAAPQPRQPRRSVRRWAGAPPLAFSSSSSFGVRASCSERPCRSTTARIAVAATRPTA
jgi:hypothetical protein